MEGEEGTRGLHFAEEWRAVPEFARSFLSAFNNSST